ncbi:LCM-domain-containing protein [Xylariaceae sp. FL0662B]|nr:LCM-domain-containing protein [Xylariaceae sp. FL0662B]
MAVVPDAKAQDGSGCSTKQRALNDLVMATNSSSIVSKRSVERIYFPDEPHFFRFFVKKFQRRAPLINRGYHLRLHVIDVAVRKFLERPSDKTKVVVNLGCGSDVLPWQCLTRYPTQCCGTKFVDIDFPDLMENKCKVVRETPELNSLLSGLRNDAANHVLLQSDQYVPIGCDLRDLASIEAALSSFVDIAHCEFMFVAEVSITYMETEAADSVIKWASTLGQVEFCLLEQILPDGRDHPFARTMLGHFEKLKTPLKSVFVYPDLQAQQNRFTSRGWSRVVASDLWQIWASDEWLSADERKRLDTIEPFDEWEEFALFASHYCVVVARVTPGDAPSAPLSSKIPGKLEIPVLPSTAAHFREHPRAPGRRRFGAAMKLKNILQEEFIVNMFGVGTNGRLRSYDLYARGPPLQDIEAHHTGPSSRMCHTITDLGDHGYLLAGGRTSPSTALRDCWLFNMGNNAWQRVDDMPVPLYRHGVTRLGHSNLALSLGGKTDSSTVFQGCLLYKPRSGWIECEIAGPGYTPVFGALCVSFREVARVNNKNGSLTNDGIQFRGLLAGGILQDGTAANQTRQWVLTIPTHGRSSISFTSLSSLGLSDPLEGEAGNVINRFGASGFVSDEGYLTVIGGIIANGVLSRDRDIVIVDISSQQYKISAACSLAITPRPLLIGTSTDLTDAGQLVVMGGGATCFSMGTYWNSGCYSISALVPGSTTLTGSDSIWNFSRTVEITEELKPRRASKSQCTDRSRVKVDIPRLQISTEAEFLDVLKAGKPVVIEGGELGACTKAWSSDYLVEKIRSERKVVVHEASNSRMDFNSKNFSYVIKTFGELMQEIADGHKLYLRALSDDHPADQPANLKVDFAQLASDFQLPDALSFVTKNTFSSVLRISGQVNMWLHYDVMANVYCQIVGSKRLVLFPPSDVDYFSFAPGASSSSVDVFSELESPSLAQTHPHEAILMPGDILFLPPLWLHTAKPLSNLGVAINVFFRNLETGYSSGRDVYGNRDLAAYERGRQDVARIANAFSKIPPTMRNFYIRRLADELAQKDVN